MTIVINGAFLLQVATVIVGLYTAMCFVCMGIASDGPNPGAGAAPALGFLISGAVLAALLLLAQ